MKKYDLPFWGQSIYTNYLETFCLFYPIIYLSTCINVDEQICIMWFHYNPIILDLFCYSDCSRSYCRQLLQLTPMSLWHTSYFLPLVRYFRFFLYISCRVLESAISPRSDFIWKRFWKLISGLQVCSFLLGTRSWKKGNMCVY